jgi:hypothetical protein
MSYTRYPFDYFLIYLLSIFHEQKHIIREVGNHFPHVIDPPNNIDAAISFGRAAERLKERRVEALISHIGMLRERYPVAVIRRKSTFDDRGILSAFEQRKEVVDAFKILGGPERRTVELCALGGVLPEDVRRIVLSKHSLDIEESVISEFLHYFFNIPLLLREDVFEYFGLLTTNEERAYKDVYSVGKEAICLHLDLDAEDFDPKVNLRSVHRLAYVQLMRCREMPAEAGRIAAYWTKILMDSHDRLKEGDDFVKRMLRVMTLFSLGEETQAFKELDSATGEILH